MPIVIGVIRVIGTGLENRIVIRRIVAENPEKRKLRLYQI